MTANPASTTPTVQTPNLGPGALKTSTRDTPFLLSQAEWITLQVYVTSALALPLTDAEMRKSLQLKPTDPMPDLTSLLEAYKPINAHCRTWRDETFPATVALADSLIHYNTQVPTYYGELSTIVAALRKKPTPELQEDFKTIVERLAEQARGYATKAAAVEQAIIAFAEATEQDRQNLEVVNTAFDQRFSDTGAEGKRLKADLEAQYTILRQQTEEYNHAVVVASTTPTYAWVNYPLPFGMIAAVVVAGVYGDRAVKAKQKMDAANAQIKRIGEQMGLNTVILATMACADQGLDTILAQANAALPVIQKIRGAWSAIAEDLSSLGQLIEQDIAQAMPVLMNLGIKTAISEWAKVAKAADSYRVHAFIKVVETKAA